MKKKTPFLDFYHETSPYETSVFLCQSGLPEDIVEMFKPTNDDIEEARAKEEYISPYAWGSEHGYDAGRFGVFRQTVVLLCAAINGEL